MRHQLLVISLLLFSIFFIFSPKAFAVVTPCNGGTGIPCTICEPNATLTECVVSGTNTCSVNGYLPDTVYCQNLPMYQCQNVDTTLHDCIDPADCGNETESCTGTGQGSCCEGFVCENNFCKTPDTCNIITESCTGTPGSQGDCCDDLICDYTKSGVLRCQEPKIITGYFCNMAGDPCLPCYEGMDNFGCDPPEYTTFGACTPICNGKDSIKYSCNSGICNESESGSYTDIAACTAACEVKDPDRRFCGTPPDKKNGINTALGCIKVESGEDLITTILRLATGVGGGIALLLILYGVFIVTTSAGMPDKLKAGGEIITSAIIGLVFVLLSLFLVQLIGINILGIPGLT